MLSKATQTIPQLNGKIMNKLVVTGIYSQGQCQACLQRAKDMNAPFFLLIFNINEFKTNRRTH